jgi:hypothetical protein
LGLERLGLGLGRLVAWLERFGLALGLGMGGLVASVGLGLGRLAWLVPGLVLDRLVPGLELGECLLLPLHLQRL